MEPEDVDSLLDRAHRLLNEGRPADSLRCLDEVEGRLLDADDRIEHASLRAHALLDMERDDEALQTLEEAIDEFPESARLLGSLGVVLSSGKDLQGAREALETAVALDPDDEVHLANLGLIHEKMRDYAEAISLYDQALDMGADLDWALQRKASALIEAGEADQARGTLKRYLSLVPGDAAQWISLAILYSDDGLFEDAFECYRQAEAIEADSPSLRLNWGVSAVRAGRLPVALEQLEHLRRAAADSTRPALLEAFILEEQGDLREALRCYTKTVTLANPHDYGELSYTFEMAMDFYARRKMRSRCERLLKRAHEANACTVELCEAYRELTGDRLERGYWFNLVIEADYRGGLEEVHELGADRNGRSTRFQRGFQVVARDRDEAVTLVLDFATRMGETNLTVCEFAREERLDDVYTGIYEVDRESLVLARA